VRRFFVIAAVSAGVVWIVVAQFVGGRPASPEKSSSEPSNEPTSSETVVASGDPEGLAEVKQAKKRAVREFVSIYYSRDKRLYDGDVDERTARYRALLEPLVTEAFLEDYVRPLENPQDQQLIRAGGSVVAAVKSFNGGHDDEVLVTITRTIRTRVNPSIIETDLELILVGSERDWQIDSLTEQY